jgi:hypothetical protein
MPQFHRTAPPIRASAYRVTIAVPKHLLGRGKLTQSRPALREPLRRSIPSPADKGCWRPRSNREWKR